MKQYGRIKILIWIITILWMTIIFWFSNQPGVVSREESGKVLIKMRLASEEDITDNGNSRISKLQRFIRKTAHVTVFLVLGILLALSIINTRFDNIKSYIIAYITGSLYGVLDEIHQMFVPGRGPQLKDVLFDSVGVLIGVLIIAILAEVVRYIRSKGKFAI